MFDKILDSQFKPVVEPLQYVDILLLIAEAHLPQHMKLLTRIFVVQRGMKCDRLL